MGWKILPKDGKKMNPVQIFWGFGGTRITVPSKVPFIWIAHAWLQLKKEHYFFFLKNAKMSYDHLTIKFAMGSLNCQHTF
jgi:hypothetical protein